MTITPLLIGLPGPVLTPQDEAHLATIRPAGVIFFARNFQDRNQFRRLVAAIHDILGPDAIMAVDHEGGRVVRCRDLVPELPSAAELGMTASAQQVGARCRAVGAALRDLGITMNLAPVLDLATPETHSSLRDRCFSTDPDVVADLGAAFVAGMQKAEIQCVGKHFPGLGPGLVDTHDARAFIDNSEEALTCGLHPFTRLIADGIDGILINHAVYPQVDPHNPAVFSRRIVHGLLRERLGFSGVIVSDDLEMGAISQHYPIGEAVRAARLAGCNLVCICHDPALQIQAYHSLCPVNS